MAQILLSVKCSPSTTLFPIIILFIFINSSLFAQPEWILNYSGAGQFEDSPVAIAVDIPGNVYIAGYVYDTDSSSRCVTIKYDKHGEERWARYYGDPNLVNGATDIAVDKDQDVYVTGYSYDTDSTSNFFTIKYNNNGDLKWNNSYTSPGNREDCSTAIALDEKSHYVYVTGYTYQTDTSSAYVTIKYSQLGEELGVEIYNGPMNAKNGALSLTVDKTGDVYVTGYTHDSTSGQNITTIKYNSSAFELKAMPSKSVR